MTEFKWIEGDTSGRLHVSTDEPGRGWLGFALNEPGNRENISLSDALFKHNGTILIASTQDGDYILKNAHRWEELAKTVIPETRYKSSIIWLNDLQQPGLNNRFSMHILQEEHRTSEDIKIILGDDEFQFAIHSGSQLSLNEKVLKISAKTGNEIAFTGALAPKTGLIPTLHLPFEGPGRGCLIINSVQIEVPFLTPTSRFPVGFQFVYSSSNGRQDEMHVHQFPLFRDNTDSLEFFVCICPYDLPTFQGKNKTNSTGTFFAFSSLDAEGRPLTLESAYITSYGHPVYLQPITVLDKFDPLQPKLTLQATINQGSGNASSIMFAPSGDFTMSVKSGNSGDKHHLLCGLSGTESLIFQDGDFMKFSTQRPAYVPNFPLPKSSTMASPAEPPGKMLKDDYVTSWLYLMPAAPTADTAMKPIRYLSQPTGATLYGNGEVADQSHRQFLGFQDTGSQIDSTESNPFPLVPYTSYQSEDEETAAQIKEFEQKIVSPVRRSIITIMKGNQPLEESLDSIYNATTPNGQLAKLHDGSYEKVLLATSDPITSPLSDLSFTNVDGPLLQALQTNQLFLVMTDNKSFKEKNPQTTSTFNNKITVGGWEFTIELGKDNTYMDYNNVLIMKGRNGQGQSLSELVKRPELWTQPDDFNASFYRNPEEPLLESPSFSGDIAGLSKWLQDYLAEAKELEHIDAAYKHFNELADNPNWTGTIVLKPSIGFPDQLSELKRLMMAEGNDMPIYGHHFGIETQPVNAKLKPEAESSIFGLVNLSHESYQINSMKPVSGISETYDFRLLHLKVAIQQGNIKEFVCLGQLTINNWFSREIGGAESERLASNAILLKGTTQLEGGLRTYSLETDSSFLFPIKGNLLANIRVDKVKYVSVKNDDANQKNRLLISGALVFHKIQLLGNRAFDILSFGKDGLLFYNLPLDITIPAETNTDLSYFMDIKKAKFTTSDKDKASTGLTLFDSISLELMNFIVGEPGEDPLNRGYLPVTASKQFIGVTGLPWFGLQFKLRAGTLGGISGNKPLELDFMLAWGGAPEKNESEDPDLYSLFIGIKLPGADRRLTLQSVIQLEYSEIVLKYHSPENTVLGGKRGFVLMLNQMAVKLLGLRLPPSGNVSMYLFGGAEEQAPIGWYAAYNKKE